MPGKDGVFEHARYYNKKIDTNLPAKGFLAIQVVSTSMVLYKVVIYSCFITVFGVGEQSLWS